MPDTAPDAPDPSGPPPPAGRQRLLAAAKAAGIYKADCKVRIFIDEAGVPERLLMEIGGSKP